MAQTYETRRRSGKHGGSEANDSKLRPAPEEKNMDKMNTARALGFRKGDFVHTGAFPGIVVSDVNSRTPVCEVWGFEHESGSAYADDLTLLSWDTFKSLAERYGFDGTAYSEAAKKAIAQAQARHAAPPSAVAA